MERIKLDICLEGCHTIIETQKNKSMKEILENYAIQVEKDFTNLYFLYNGDLLNTNETLERIVKNKENINEIKI